MLAHLATFAGTPCHFASDDGARLYDLSRLRRLPHEFDLIGLSLQRGHSFCTQFAVHSAAERRQEFSQRPPQRVMQERQWSAGASGVGRARAAAARNIAEPRRVGTIGEKNLAL